MLEAAAARRRQARPEPVNPREPDKKPPRLARMRTQIQEGATHYGSSVVDAADPDRGVTAVELERNMLDTVVAAREPVPQPRQPGDRRVQLPARYVPAAARGDRQVVVAVAPARVPPRLYPSMFR